MDDARSALERIANEYRVKPSTLAQWADGAGSYTIRNAHSTPHKRRLPPRGSPEGEELATRIHRECGTESVRTLAPK